MVLMASDAARGGAPRKEDMPKYLQMLKTSQNAKDRALAAQMLGKRGQINANDVADAIEPLTKSVNKDIDASVRKAAAEALGNIGAEATTVVPALRSALKDKTVPVKMAAAVALGQFGTAAKDAVPDLRALMKELNDKKNSKIIAGAIMNITAKKKKG